MRVGSKTGQNFALFHRLRKTGEGWWRCLYEIGLFVSHIGSMHQYTFYPVAMGASGHTLDG